MQSRRCPLRTRTLTPAHLTLAPIRAWTLDTTLIPASTSEQVSCWKHVVVGYSKCNAHETSWRSGLAKKKKDLQAERRTNPNPNPNPNPTPSPHQAPTPTLPLALTRHQPQPQPQP